MFNINIHCTYQFVFEILLNEDSNQRDHLRQFHREQISDVLSWNPIISSKCTKCTIIYKIPLLSISHGAYREYVFGD